MRAARFHQYGPPDVLQLERVALPSVGPYDVRVLVHAAAVNPIDCKIRSGAQRAIIRLRLPWTLGLDLSGVVDQVGPKVTRFRVGDEVYGSPTHDRPGAYADYIAVDEGALAPKPANLSHVEAAAVPLVGLTAWQSLEAGAVRAGQEVLILAGSGGVGSMAIQLAHARGARVTTTASAANHDLVRSLGADVVVDRSVDVWARVHDLDFVLATLGSGDRFRALRAVKRGGTVVSLVADIPRYSARYGPTLGAAVAAAGVGAFLGRARLTGRRGVAFNRRTDGAGLERLSTLLASGAIRPVIDRVFPLEEVVEAHRLSEEGRAVGKIVLTLR